MAEGYGGVESCQAEESPSAMMRGAYPIKVTLHRAGGPLVIEGSITSSGSDPSGRVDLQITGEDGQPWAALEMDLEDALEIGSLGFNALLNELRARRDASS